MGLFSPVKRFFKKPSSVLKPLTKPMVELASGVAELQADLFSATTSPFLQPISNILDALQPRARFSVDLPNPTITLAGGTNHRLLIPGLNAPIEGPSQPNADITGGLLADLAFKADDFRTMRSDLSFLNKTMNKGLFPHRNDLFEVVLLVHPYSAYGAGDFIILAELELDGKPVGDLMLHLDVGDIQANREFQIAKLAPVWKAAGLSRSNVTESFLPQLGSNMPTLMIDRCALEVPGESLHTLRVNIRYQKKDGRTVVDSNAVKDALVALEVRVNRINDDLEETLHRYSEFNPADPFTTQFQIDRRGFLTEEDEKNQAPPLAKLGENKGLAASANALAEVIELIDSMPDAPPENPSGASGQDALFGLLTQRVSHGERIRKTLGEARRQLRDFRPKQNAHDYRLRYKVKIENPGTNARFVNLEHTNKSIATGQTVGGFTMEDLRLTNNSVYETTIYPVKATEDMASTVRLSTKQSEASMYRLSLSTSYGDQETQVKAVRLRPENNNPPQKDEAQITWEIKDMADY